MGKVLVTGVKKYNFENANKEVIKGNKVSYLSEIKMHTDKIEGYLPIQANVEDEVVQSLKEIPGIYKEIYEMVPGKNNAPTPKLVGLEFVKPIDFAQLFK